MKLMEPLDSPGHYDASDPFENIGNRNYPHTGSDWNGVSAGFDARAIGSGIVVNKQWDDGNGNTVTVRLPDGHYYAYLHLNEPPPVTVGQAITIGQVIGHVGDTGYNSDGAHLHITVSDSPTAYVGGGNKIDPYKFIQQHINDTDPGTPTVPGDNEKEQDMYIRRNSTGEIAVFGSDYRSITGGTAGRHVFASQSEYNGWRSVIQTYNSQIDQQGLDPRGKKFLPPAALTSVMGVDDVGWGIICGLYGV